MKSIDRCPECEKKLTNNVGCGCGWRIPKGANNMDQVNDHQCQYRSKGYRCPMPGTMCAHPYSNGPWYCIEHHRERHNPIKSEEYLEYIKENFEKEMKKRRDWRDKIDYLLSK